MSAVRVVYADTDNAPPHFGPGGSRLGVAISGAILGACHTITEKLRRVAAVLLQAPFEQVELMDGMLRVRGVPGAVSYSHLRAHETVLDLVCRLLLEKKN